MTDEPVYPAQLAFLASSNNSFSVASLVDSNSPDASLCCVVDLAPSTGFDLVGANHACPFGNGPSYRSHYFAACPVGVSGFPLEAVVF